MRKSKIILLDVDSVLNSFDKEILDLVRPETTIKEMEDLKDWDIFKLLNEKQLLEMHKILEDSDFWQNLKPKKISQDMVEAMRSDGEKVIFCTSPWAYCRSWSWVRRWWLERHFKAKGREDIIITGAKDLIFGDVFIDDKPDNVINWRKRWAKKGGKGLLFETNTNKYDPKAKDLWPRIRESEKEWNFVKESKESALVKI